MTILTMAVPETLFGATNNLAMVLGGDPADQATYVIPTWQDGVGIRYAVSSCDIGILTQDPIAPLPHPSWDGPEFIDMTAARAAQAVVVRLPDDPRPIPKPDGAAILTLTGDDPHMVLRDEELTRIPQIL